MEEGGISMLMERLMMEIGWKVICMGLGNSLGLKENSMLEDLLII